jgi:rubrerythrin
MDRGALIGELARLRALEIDVAHAAAAAEVLLPPGPLRDELAVQAADHRRHASWLEEQLLWRGVDLTDPRPRVRGLSAGAREPTPPPSGLSEVLARVLGNAQLAGSLYAKALGRQPPREVQAVLARIDADERRHQDWLRRALARVASQPPPAR